MSLFSRLSIETKMPLAIAMVILTVGAAVSVAGYLVIRQTLLESASDRLTTLVETYRATLQTNTVAAQARFATTARSAELLAYLKAPSAKTEVAAREALRPRGPQAENTIRTELRDKTGALRLAHPAGERGPSPEASKHGGVGGDDWPGLARISTSAAPEADGVGYGSLRAIGDTVLYPVVARIETEPGGYFVAWRKVATTSEARAQIAKILGSEAAFYIANADGSVWSDLGRPIAAPAGDVKPGALAELERPGIGRVLAATAPIAATPWIYTIEFPTRAIYAPSLGFLRTMAVIAAVCVTAGMLIAWLLSRRVTVSLRRLAVAAAAISPAESRRRAQASGDEIRRLTDSFNSMAAEVHDAHSRLQALVEERTRELQLAQESLARREKLALVGHFAAGVGHEIRNPLGVMANAIYYLETILPNAPGEVQEYLGILRNQVQHSSRIVNDLLELSRMSPARRKPIHLRAVVDERLKRLSTETMRFEADIPADLPPVHVDPLHAGQVIDNLLTNAIQAMDGGPGTVSVRARRTASGLVQFEVADTGPGIAPEHVGKIFEPLFTTKARGIGLGLALSKSLAQANGGDLCLISQPGQSARFAFTLPVAPSSVAESSTPAMPQSA